MICSSVEEGDFAEQIFVLVIKCLADGHHDFFAGVEIAVERGGYHDFGDATMVAMIVIEGEFVGDPEADEEGECHAHGEAEDIDEGVGAVFQEVANGDGEIIFKHAR